MAKGQLIEEIRQLNNTATAQFLEQFEPEELQQYLEHLQAAQRREVRIAGWTRKPAQRLRMVS